MAEQCYDEVNERTAFVVHVVFTDEDGAPETPTAATYRVDDEERKVNIVPVTAITPLSTSADIVITSDQNFILRPRNDFEIRTVTVEWDYTSALGAMHATSQYQYKLINLYGVVDVPSASVSPSASASSSV